VAEGIDGMVSTVAPAGKLKSLSGADDEKLVS
jgi:hypothetical protein